MRHGKQGQGQPAVGQPTSAQRHRREPALETLVSALRCSSRQFFVVTVASPDGVTAPSERMRGSPVYAPLEAAWPGATRPA